MMKYKDKREGSTKSTNLQSSFDDRQPINTRRQPTKMKIHVWIADNSVASAWVLLA